MSMNGVIGLAMDKILNADIVVGNDSGLVHYAGTMNKPTYVLWKNTKRPRCENAGINSHYAREHNWTKDWYDWINEIEKA